MGGPVSSVCRSVGVIALGSPGWPVGQRHHGGGIVGVSHGLSGQVQGRSQCSFYAFFHFQINIWELILKVCCLNAGNTGRGAWCVFPW